LLSIAKDYVFNRNNTKSSDLPLYSWFSIIHDFYYPDTYRGIVISNVLLLSINIVLTLLHLTLYSVNFVNVTIYLYINMNVYKQPDGQSEEARFAQSVKMFQGYRHELVGSRLTFFLYLCFKIAILLKPFYLCILHA
jgi:hypothetical protein